MPDVNIFDDKCTLISGVFEKFAKISGKNFFGK
jgi:hypothetical protein